MTAGRGMRESHSLKATHRHHKIAETRGTDTSLASELGSNVVFSAALTSESDHHYADPFPATQQSRHRPPSESVNRSQKLFRANQGVVKMSIGSRSEIEIDRPKILEE